MVTSAVVAKGDGWLMCQFTRWDGILAAVAGAVGTIVDLAQSRFNLAQNAMETRHVALMADSKRFIYHRPAALCFVKLVSEFRVFVPRLIPGHRTSCRLNPSSLSYECLGAESSPGESQSVFGQALPLHLDLRRAGLIEGLDPKGILWDDLQAVQLLANQQRRG